MAPSPVIILAVAPCSSMSRRLIVDYCYTAAPCTLPGPFASRLRGTTLARPAESFDNGERVFFIKSVDFKNFKNIIKSVSS